MNEEIHHVIHFLYLSGVSTASAEVQLTKAYGDSAPTRSGICYWYKEFREGRQSASLKPKPGRPLLNGSVEKVRICLDEFPFASARFISTQVALSVNTVIRILKQELHLKKRYSRWVPKFLTQSQKAERVKLSKMMLQKLTKLTSNQRQCVVTCGESWFFATYYHDSKWCEEGEDPPLIPKRLLNDEKVMFFAAFSINGIILLKPLPTNTSFTSAYMCTNILEELTVNAQNIMKNRCRHHLILHFDNAKPHTAKRTLQKIEELQWEKLDHPPYSPDISPCDFFLFGYVKTKLPQYNCSSIYELTKAIDDICSKITSTMWENVFNAWINRLNHVFDSGGEYFYSY